MNNSRTILTAFIMLVVIIGSLWLGTGVVTNQTETLIQVGAIVLILTCAFLGQRIWLLYIFFASVTIPIIRGFTTLELGQAVLVGFSVLLFMMRRLKMHLVFSELDFWRFLTALAVIQVYLRNPVGLNIFGADSVGGKPYFLAGLALLAGFVLSKYRVPERDIRWTMPLTILGGFLAFPINRFRGGMGRGPSVGNVGVIGEGLEGQSAGRSGTAGAISELLNRILISRISPLRACFHPLWAPVVLLVMAFAAASGYRNTVANAGLLLLAGIAYRGGRISIIISVFIGVCALGMLALVNLAFPLPPSVQRALSPFPGTWEERYVGAAENSTEWRIEMWKDALLTEKWINNKLLGDGLGFTREELSKMENLSVKGAGRSLGGLTTQQESMMISGNYHSGPIQTIRTVGYVGLFIMMLAMIRLAVHTHREILRCRGTEWYPVLLFFGVPIVIYPIFFFFFFGTFSEAATFIFLQSGFIDLLRNNLPLPPYVKAKRTPYVLMSHRNQPATGA
jgi:hypothetical protein